MSRASLYIAENGERVENEDAQDCLNRFYGGPDQHGEFLRQAGIHMTVAGDGYIVGEGAMSSTEDDAVWMVAAACEVKSQADDTYKINGEVIDEEHSLVIRFWRPHPRKPHLPDSPTRPLLPILYQLERLTKYVDAQLDSRLTGNGMMLFPASMAFPVPTEIPDGLTAQQAGLRAWMQDWADQMSVALEKPESAAARVPNGLMGDAQDLKEVRHVTTWSELDEHAPKLREEAIRRVALGLDMPADALLGNLTGDGANHWGAWQTDDSLIKSHVEPLLKLLTEALTTDYLRIMLEEQYGWKYEDTLAFTVEADTAEMRLRPNRSKEAFELWDRGEISGTALRREAGFEETDKMDDEEKKSWLLYKLAQGSPSPELVARAAEELGIDIGEVATTPDQESRGERPLPRSLEEHPTNEPPERPAAASEALLASGEAAVQRALERSGNRIKNIVGRDRLPAGVAAVDLYQYVTLSRQQLNVTMEDAWANLGRLTLPAGVSLEDFETALDNYTRMLISSKEPFNRAVLGKYLGLAIKE
jgi:hypothetical protein